MTNTMKTLVIVSLVFNISFISIFFYHRFIDREPLFPPPPGAPHFKKGEFTEQRKTMRECRQKAYPAHKAVMEAKRDFFQELAKPVINEREITRKFQILVSKTEFLEKTVGDNFIQMRKKMTPEQAQEFFTRIDERLDERHQKIKKFKENQK